MEVDLKQMPSMRIHDHIGLNQSFTQWQPNGLPAFCPMHVLYWDRIFFDNLGLFSFFSGAEYFGVFAFHQEATFYLSVETPFIHLFSPSYFCLLKYDRTAWTQKIYLTETGVYQRLEKKRYLIFRGKKQTNKMSQFRSEQYVKNRKQITTNLSNIFTYIESTSLNSCL